MQDRYLLQKGLRNYWGYNTLGFFAPEPRYLSDNTLDEMRIAVRRLHAAGIEVILDVVYNHTAEGSELGPTLSFRGLDNASYYRLVADNPRHCVNDTGTGNTVNLSHPRVLQMVMDSLRYWVTSFHVDGFRFDLGVTLGREAHGFDPGSGFFDAMRQDPVLSRVKLISEPWDIGPGGYQLGNHPPGFAEWNDRFRDGVRRFWRGDEGQRSDFAGAPGGLGRLLRPAAAGGRGRRSTTSPPRRLHPARHGELRRAPQRGQRRGQQRRPRRQLLGQLGRRGADRRSRHPRHAPAPAARACWPPCSWRRARPCCWAATSSAARRSGNNNAYCQDNEISWVDWKQAESAGGQERCTGFAARIVALRHRHAVLRAPRFLHGRDELAAGHARHRLVRRTGELVSNEAWNNPKERAWCCAAPAAMATAAVSILTAFFNATARGAALSRCRRRGRPARLLLDSAEPDAPERDLSSDEPDDRPAQRRADREQPQGPAAMTSFARDLPFGATLVDAGPHALPPVGARPADDVAVEIEGLRPRADDARRRGLVRGRGGVRRRRALSLSAGRRAWPCPIRRRALQADDVHGPSLVVDPRAYRWRHPDWRGRPWHETVLYELHAGSLGGFAGVQATLPRPGRARHHRRRADAGQRFPRHAQLGLRRRAALRARRRLRHARRAEGAGRRRARPRA